MPNIVYNCPPSPDSKQFYRLIIIFYPYEH